jgi:hypothetical protein
VDSWRDRARPIVGRVLAETAGQPDPAIRKALRDAYPFGPRTRHPYKIWCDEVARQRRRGKYAPNAAPAPLLDRIAEIERQNEEARRAR